MKDEIKEILEIHIKYNEDLLPKNQQKILDYINNLQEKIYKAIHLIRHNDIMDYRVFEEKLLNILQGEDKDE